MSGPLETLWRESLALYLRASATVLEGTAEGLKAVESAVSGTKTATGVDLGKPLDLESPEGREFLTGLQGNILKGHGRDHAMHLFVCFGRPKNEGAHAASVAKIRRWIDHMAKERVTSAAMQWTDKEKERPLTMLLLSSQGYEFLGERRPRDGAFREGMRNRAHQLDDPPVDEWEARYRLPAEDLHALVIVADKDAATLDRMKATIETELASTDGLILLDERGRQKRDETMGNRAIENFGYADGVSQPQLIDDGCPTARKYDQRAPLKLVLEKDRHGSDGYGSFLVFRKLEQDVSGFDQAVQEVARKLGRSPDLVGAMAIGRFKDGTPLTTHGSPKPGYDPRQDEDFDFDNDLAGNRCPMHAHVRKVNPRGSLGFLVNVLAREQERRIARRGITYEDGGKSRGRKRRVGLLFMCFQSDVRDQFEFIQRSWVNDPDFSEPGTGLDPVVGQSGGSAGKDSYPKWPTGYGSGGRKRLKFGEYVKLLGGEYFFAPSISGLKELGRS